MRKRKRIGIAGAGFAGAVVAHELAKSGLYDIEVFDERDHLAGNCFTERDRSTGVMLHLYGPHIFHTSREDVWEFMQKFTRFGAYTNRVKAVTARGVFSLPINLLTINQFFQTKFNPVEAAKFIAERGDQTIGEPKDFEEQALKMMGRELYENFFYGYTKKQWGMEPRKLPASILQRLPMRFTYDDNYYASKYQGSPLEGYTPIVERMLDSPHIQVHLATRFTPKMKPDFDHTFFSGPMDAYFDFADGRLQYRSLVFQRHEADGDFQGNPVLNYCETSVPFTRISEHKHFAPWEKHERTVWFEEYSKETEPGDIPYYPVRLREDKEMLSRYVDRAKAESGITFIGRLGTYRYLDMHMVVGESLDLAHRCLSVSDMSAWPIFSAAPLPGMDLNIPAKTAA